MELTEEAPNEEYPAKGDRWIDRFTKKVDQTIPIAQNILRFGVQAKHCLDMFKK